MGQRKGHTGNPHGRPKGVPNKFTMNAKEAFQHAFDTIGGADALAKWAELNKTDFFKIYSKLIPTDVKIDPESSITVVVKQFTPKI